MIDHCLRLGSRDNMSVIIVLVSRARSAHAFAPSPPRCCHHPAQHVAGHLWLTFAPAARPHRQPAALTTRDVRVAAQWLIEAQIRARPTVRTRPDDGRSLDSGRVRLHLHLRAGWRWQAERKWRPSAPDWETCVERTPEAFRNAGSVREYLARTSEHRIPGDASAFQDLSWS